MHHQFPEKEAKGGGVCGTFGLLINTFKNITHNHSYGTQENLKHTSAVLLHTTTHLIRTM